MSNKNQMQTDNIDKFEVFKEKGNIFFLFRFKTKRV